MMWWRQASSWRHHIVTSSWYAAEPRIIRERERERLRAWLFRTLVAVLADWHITDKHWLFGMRLATAPVSRQLHDWRPTPHSSGDRISHDSRAIIPGSVHFFVWGVGANSSQELALELVRVVFQDYDWTITTFWCWYVLIIYTEKLPVTPSCT